MVRATQTPASTNEAGTSLGEILAAHIPQGSGRSLPHHLADEFSARFRHDLSNVRIHAGSKAEAAAAFFGADAFALGDQVALGSRAPRGGEPARQLLAHELAHVVQQRGHPPGRWLAPASRSAEAEARRAGRLAASGHAPGRLTIRPASQVGFQPAEAEAQPAAEIGSTPFGRYVDRFEEIYYDFDYRPAQPGHLSKWIRVSYADGTLIDINIDEISEDTLAPDEMRAAMVGASIGRGDRLFPAVLNRQTTPGLYAARCSVLEAMDQYNLNFMLAALPAVFFVITLPIGFAGGAGGRVPRATRTARPRPVTRGAAAARGTGSSQGASGSAAATTTTRSAEEIGAEIGRSVAGRTSGKMAGVVEQVSARGLSQEAAATATESAVRTIGLRVGPRTALPNGNLVVTSVQLGSRQPVLVVRPDGSVFRATADLVLEGLEVVVRNVTPVL